MECPECGRVSSIVVDSRTTKSVGPLSVLRRRECRGCKYRYSTVEIYYDTIATPPKVQEAITALKEIRNAAERAVYNLKPKAVHQ